MGRSTLLLLLPFFGFGYGSLWCLQPLLVVENFGLTAYGSKYAVMSLAAVVGSTPLCRLVVPFFYDAHADEAGWCIGADCFMGSLLAASGFCLIGALVACFLDRRSSSHTWQPMHVQAESELPEFKKKRDNEID